MITAKEIMHQDFATAERSEVLSTVIGRLIKEQQESALIFSDKQFLGMFLPHHFFKKRLDISQMKIAASTEPVPLLYLNDSIVQMATLMFSANASQLPVMDKKIIGIVHVLD